MTTTNSAELPANRYCDVVMKGGITSGVVYPPAIVKLSEQYHFKNIGGTSAGAIAAALTAAAEFRRRKDGSDAGFKLLANLPTTLGTADESGMTQLFRLFQPDRSCARLFRILTGSLNASGTLHRVFLVLWSSVSSYGLASLAGVVLSGLAAWWMASVAVGVGLFVVLLPIFVGWAIYRDVTQGLVANNYGMCKGLTTRAQWGNALTPWLHGMIQEAAGLDLKEPLTFGHLWQVTGGPPPSKDGAPVRSIDLQMFTTNLSHGRPYMMPHMEPSARLFYQPAELASYLPPEVMTWFDAKSIPYEPNTRMHLGKSDPPKEKAPAGLREIPKPEDFPVILAARMSLSFPVLFAAVPLWAIDYEPPQADRGFQRCLFSDGGISSNFPMHLFDGLVPQWPTFGFDLEPKLPNQPEWTFLPVGYMQGIADRWTRFDAQAKPASRMGGFLMSIPGTMQNWNDNTQARSAGVRDRVVRVRLSATEGGMNLNMKTDVIKAVADRGGEAAEELIARYLGPPAAGASWDGWSQQRLSRLDVFLYSLNQKLPGMLRALSEDVPHAKPYSKLIEEAANIVPPGHQATLTVKQRVALEKLIEALRDAAKEFEREAGDYPTEPLPEPELRARSVL